MISITRGFVAGYCLIFSLLAHSVLPAYSDDLNAGKQVAAEGDKALPASDKAPPVSTGTDTGKAPTSVDTSSHITPPATGTGDNLNTNAAKAPSTGLPTANTAQPPKAAAAAAAQSEPPPPKGFEAAVKLYNTHKYAPAAAEFEKFIKAGVADTNTHLYLAYCYYSQRLYSKAVKEFSWVAKNAKHSISLQRDAENTAYTLTCYLHGICPGNCLKANDPRWHHGHFDGFPDNYIWVTFSYPGGSQSYSQNHIGDVIEYENGRPVDKGKCPICGGTGRVSVLKDGQPLSR